MTTQIAVKLSDQVVEELDRLVARGSFGSRSEAVRHAVDALVRSDERQRVAEAFAEGFRRVPDRDEELADATRLALEAIHEEPWERWW
jgi:Arc/MetJ-type ribon-helix-helix transcriptional regulator